MMTLPTPMIRLLRPLEAAFSEQTWDYAKVLLVGAILAPAKRTVTSALRVMGMVCLLLTYLRDQLHLLYFVGRKGMDA